MAYKTFANGFPLPASDLNNYLMNQSVIVFADSTARTAALPTPTEGMITYLEDTNNYQYWDSAAWVDLVEAPDLSTLIPKSTVTTAGDLIVADGASSVTRLGVGADGSLVTVSAGSPTYLAPGTDDQVLTLASGAPVWADAAGGGGSAGFSLLSTTALTGAAAITITGLSGYSDYILFFEGVSGSSGNTTFKIVNWNGSRTGDMHINWEKGNTTGDSSPNPASTLRLGKVESSSWDIYGMVTILGAGDNGTAIVSSVSGSRATTGAGDISDISQGIINKNSLPLSSLELEVNTGQFDSGNLKVYGR